MLSDLQKNNKTLKRCLASLFLAIFLFVPVIGLQAREYSEFVPKPTNISAKDKLIRGTSINFSNVAIYLDKEFLTHANTEIGVDGWQEWEIDLPEDLEFGLHQIETVTEYFNNTKSATSTFEFDYQEKKDGPTIFNPVLNSETNFQQPWIVGLAYDNTNVKIYIDEKLDGEVAPTQEVGIPTDNVGKIVDFKYKPSKRLEKGFHIVQAISEDENGKLSNWSKKIIFEIKYGQTKLIAPNLTEEIGKFIAPVPAPTLLEPKNGIVQKDNKLVVKGLVHNEHYVKIFDNENLIGEFMPVDYESGVTSFEWHAKQSLDFGQHKIYARCINPRGQISGQSNILNLIILQPDYYVSELKGTVASAEDENKIDISDEILAEQVDEVVDKINNWVNWWKWLIGIVILIAISLLGIWILSYRQKKKKNKNKEKIKIKTEIKKEKNQENQNQNSPPEYLESEPDEPIIKGPEIDYGIDEDKDNQKYKPPPPPPGTPNLGI